MAKAGNPPGAKEFKTRITRILTNRMNPLVEIGAIRVYASTFCVFSGVSWADKRPAPNYPR
jgi:dTDP-4-dehydrorhamnose reductase